ncbi:MAG: AAA family ATPase [Candidatus Woesearchaeota archaeon]
MIIGLTGTFGSGKTTIADHLKSKNFQYITISDLVREETKKQNLPIEREILQNIGNKMRELHGNDYWAKRVLEKINTNENWIVDGIRNPGEIEELKKIKGFLLIAFNAPIEKRLKRMTNQKGIRAERVHSDPKEIEEIKRLEARDRGINEAEFGQQVEKCMAQADHEIHTNEPVEETIKKINKLLEIT